ncbi:MAG: histidine triad nucleotide-binding protein [Epsilonproteobacteria bacterium]|jgi:histidine triad (HIT) family protein|nr:histidine triad nucleotide-binding protein [Campylobacterota bacterium]NPA89356.1 histidine triad nucleotide-binding protein [Campylobacterota bacterium]
MGNNCIFCQIVAGEIPSKKVLEDDNFLAFHDINPVAPVHILIIPKTHYPNFAQTPPEVFTPMAEFIKKVAEKVGVTDYRLITNNGKGGGQEVFHLHIHFIANPGGTLKWGKLV